MGLLESDGELINEGSVWPFDLDPDRPDEGTQVRVPTAYFSYQSDCTIDGFVHEIHEYTWIWRDSIRLTNDTCHLRQGMSGSPLVDVSTDRVVGVANTVYEGGEACTLMNPCEVDENGNRTVRADGRYGQQTHELYGCIDASFDFDPTRPACRLVANAEGN